MAVGGILSSGVVMIEAILVAIGLRTTSQHDIPSPKKTIEYICNLHEISSAGQSSRGSKSGLKAANVHRRVIV